MNPTNLHPTRLAALELLRLRDEGIQINPDRIHWAIEITSMTGKCFKPAVNQHRILCAIAQSPPGGMMSREIAKIAGMSRMLTSSTLYYMQQRRIIWWAPIPMRTRFFPSAEALELGRPIVAAEEAQRKAMPKSHMAGGIEAQIAHVAAVEARRAARKAATAANLQAKKAAAADRLAARGLAAKQKLDKKEAAKREAANKIVFRPAKPAKSKAVTCAAGPAITPPNVQIQRIPSKLDTRYAVDPASIRDGFHNEWKRLRGEA